MTPYCHAMGIRERWLYNQNLLGTHAYAIIVSYYVELRHATIILTLYTNEAHIKGYITKPT